YQAQVVTGPEVHFGLGAATKADVMRVIWTNGLPSTHFSPNADQEICEQQSLAGSCPYLYTWNGKKFEFVTDLLWNAPIGMRVDQNNYVPYRQWEYLKVPGEKLVPRNGKYVLQFTEELFEATYVDQVRLLAIDHPTDVDIFSNEKVGSAELAKFQIHTVRQPRLPVAARDKHGRDVLPIVSKTDGQYLRGYDAKICQGITDEHFLELDLGKLKNPAKITLFLTGWIYPPTPSIRLALSQNPQQPVVRPPYLQVPDEQGNWKEVVPFMGFPGGKTKTIAVDVSKIFLTNDYRMRIVTSQEIYWDSAFFTLDESPAPFTQTELSFDRADIHFRGCSRSYYDSRYGPELYDYDQLQSLREWPAMGGMFTRYGDVRELLTTTDDRLVIIGAGDEITLEFAVPERPVPAGWKRDFIMNNVGWDKDCDRNTVYGHTVEPLPFNAMSRYPYNGNEAYPDTPLHRETLGKYHNRAQDPRKFWKLLVP
ncbi:MAG: ASPIC/UnbV domain-containing protein, partial [Planctomycetota bacterium]